jgi:hypothetical protein
MTSCPLPDTAKGTLTIRVGEPLGRARKGWKEDIEFLISDGIGTLEEKCYESFKRIQEQVAAEKKGRLAFREDRSLYYKKTRYEAQDKYLKLTNANFDSSLEKRWRLIPLDDLQQLSSISFEFFLYITNEALQTFHRATATRLESACLSRLAYNI